MLAELVTATGVVVDCVVMLVFVPLVIVALVVPLATEATAGAEVGTSKIFPKASTSSSKKFWGLAKVE